MRKSLVQKYARLIKACIDDAHSITNIDFCVLDLNGTKIATTFEAEQLSQHVVAAFAASIEDSDCIQNGYYYKVHCLDQPILVLIAKGSTEEVRMIGRLIVRQLETLLSEQHKSYDKSCFIQSLLLNQLRLPEVLEQARQLRIRPDVSRVVYLLETKTEGENVTIDKIRHYLDQFTVDFVTSLGENIVVIVREVDQTDSYKQLNQYAWTLLDMFTVESRDSLRIAYGTIVPHIKDIHVSYQEAKTALEIGRYFYAQRSILSYNSLGIGRLIYELPIEYCDKFLEEVFDNGTEDYICEMLSVVNTLFSNNLNVSKTARQLYIHRNTLVYQLEKLYKVTGLDVRSFEDALIFRIALMIRDYLKNSKK